MKRRARLTLVTCLAAMGLVLGGCAGGGYPSVYVGVSGPGPYYGGTYGGYGGPYGGGYWGPGRVGGGVVITGRPY